jgi:hypothetical protein
MIDYNGRGEEWYKRAINENDEFVKFILFYISLEVSIKDKFNDIRSIKDDFKIRSNFFDKIDSSKLNNLIKILNLNPLINMDSSRVLKWSGKIENQQDFDGIIEFIIRARNNLFHGDKGPDSNRDLFIVKWGTEILQPLVQVILQF